MTIKYTLPPKREPLKYENQTTEVMIAKISTNWDSIEIHIGLRTGMTSYLICRTRDGSAMTFYGKNMEDIIKKCFVHIINTEY